MEKTVTISNDKNQYPLVSEVGYLLTNQVLLTHDDSEVTALLPAELQDFNVHLASDAPGEYFYNKRASVIDLAANNIAMVGDSLKVSPMALFNLLAVILNDIDSFIRQMNALQSEHPDIDVSGNWHLHLQDGLLRFAYCRELPESLQLKCIEIFVGKLAERTC